MVVAAGVALGVVADVYCWMLMPKVLPFVCLYEIHVLMIYFTVTDVFQSPCPQHGPNEALTWVLTWF